MTSRLDEETRGVAHQFEKRLRKICENLGDNERHSLVHIFKEVEDDPGWRDESLIF